MDEGNILKESIEKGRYLLEQLSGLKEKYNCVKAVRGIGLMCAIEFDDSFSTERLTDLHKQLFDAGFLVGLRLATRLMRFYPPLIVEEAMIKDMVMALDRILEAETIA